MKIKISNKGDFKYTTKFLDKAQKLKLENIANRYGSEGVIALQGATPRDTGETADSWRYEIRSYKHNLYIYWINDSRSDGIPIVILLQYGHVGRDGTFIEGYDFINPVIRPIFRRMAKEIWKEVKAK